MRGRFRFHETVCLDDGSAEDAFAGDGGVDVGQQGGGLPNTNSQYHVDFTPLTCFPSQFFCCYYSSRAVSKPGLGYLMIRVN